MHSFRLKLAVLGGCVAQLAVGGSYVVSILLVYVVSFYRLQGESSLTLQDGNWIGPGLVTVTGLFGPVAAKLPSYMSPRSALLLGNGACISAMFLASLAPSFRIYLICNLLYGLGVPITGMSTVAMLWSHYPERKGLMSGLVLSSLVLSSSLSSLLIPLLANPRNLNPDIIIDNGVVTNHLYSETVANRLPFTMRGIGLLYLVCTLVAAPLYIPLNKVSESPRASFEENKCGTLANGLRHRIFLCMYAIGFVSTSFGLYMSAVYKNFGQEVINDDHFFAWVNTVNSVCSAVFRVVSAYLSDHFGFHAVFPWLLGLQIIVGYCYYFTRVSPVLFMIASGLALGCEGGFIALLAALCGDMFGKRMGVSVYSILFTAFISSLLFSIILQSLFLGLIGYFYMFLIVNSLNLVSAGLLILMPRNCPWRREDKEVLIEFPNRDEQ